MIQLLSKLKVADNSGARLVQCIKVLKSRSKVAAVGDLITVTVKKARPHKQVQKKDVRLAVVVRTKSTYVRPNGIKVSLGENACVILNSRSNKTPIGTRIIGPIPVRELRKSKIIKCILLAKSVIRYYNYITFKHFVFGTKGFKCSAFGSEASLGAPYGALRGKN